MIRGLIDYALNNRFIVLALALLLLIWGAVSFHSSGGSVPRCGKQLCPDHHSVAGPRRRRGRAASHHPHRNPDEWNSAPGAPSLGFPFRAF